MEIEKAIKIKKDYLKDNQPYDLPELEEADRLSIEALKTIAFWNEKQLPQHQIHLLA